MRGHANILIVEDNDDDFDLLMRFFKRKKYNENGIYRCIDGGHTFEYLFLINNFQRTLLLQVPSLIILDLELPDLNGKSLLRQIKAMWTLKDTPVVILSSSDNQVDIEECRALGAE